MMNSHYQISSFNLSTDKKNQDKLNWSIRGNIFISGDHSKMIASKIDSELWGNHHYQLYHYMDYIFRTRIMKNEVKVYNYKNGESIAVFHTGLFSTESKKGLYLLAKPNNHPKKNPYWAISKENIEKTNRWLLTKEDLMNDYAIKEYDIPKNIEFIKKENNSNKFNRNLLMNFNWYKILSHYLYPRSKDTIVKEIKNNGCSIEKKKIKYLLANAFEDGMKNTLNKRNIHDYIVPGLFLDFVDQQYWINLMMHVSILYQNKKHTFIVVIQESYHQNEYEFVDILSLKQGFSNGRFISKLPEFWKPKSPKITKNINNKSDKQESITNKLKSITIPIPTKAPILQQQTPKAIDTDSINGNCSPISSMNDACNLLMSDISANSNSSKYSKLSISSQATVISVDNNMKSPTPFSLESNENKCNNENGLISYNNNSCNIVGSLKCQYNSQTGLIENSNTTRFENKALGLITEFTTYSSGKYISTIYSAQTNELISHVTGNTNLLSLNLSNVNLLQLNSQY